MEAIRPVVARFGKAKRRLPRGCRRGRVANPPTGNFSNRNYDDNSRQEILRNIHGNVIGYQVHLSDGSRLRYTHSSNNPYARYYLTAAIDPHGVTTTFDYSSNRLTYVLAADKDDIYLQYGNPTYPNRVTSVSGPGGRQVTLGYAAGNLTLVTYPTTYYRHYTYDALNRVGTMVDQVGTTQYTYHQNGLLQTENGPWANDTVTYSYHLQVPHLRTGLTLQQPSGSWTQTYGYDAARRLETVGGTSGNYTYTYRGAGTLWTNLALPNSSRITNAYSSIGALTNTTLITGSGTVRNRHSYGYNLAHQRTRQTRTDASYVDYTYDHIGQLRTAVGTGGQSTENLGYGYDPAWNLHKRTNGVTVHTFTVDVKNQLVSTPYGTCAYDANGNLTSEGGTRTFTYDDENRLSQVFWGSGSYRTDFAYDGRGRLRTRSEYYWTGSSWSFYDQTRYFYDGMLLIQERTSANTPTVSYARGQDLSGTLEGAGGIGGLLARSDQYSGGTWGRHVFYHADGNGNVTALIDSAQTVVAAYRYNPYGQLLGSSGTLAGVNTLRFSSKPWFQSEGLYYYGYRFNELHRYTGTNEGLFEIWIPPFSSEFASPERYATEQFITFYNRKMRYMHSHPDRFPRPPAD
jgi:YD repeat-containing protein